MNKIEWQTNARLTVGNFQIPCAPYVASGEIGVGGIRRHSKLRLISTRAVYPLWKLYVDLLIDGFIEREIGRLISRYTVKDSVFLEIGCGDMNLRKFVRSGLWYNALDLELSDFHLTRVLREMQNANIVVASATEIPAPANSVSLIVSTEAFYEIPDVDKAMQEIHRIAAPEATLICSIPNYYCYKYVKKGPHPKAVNSWTYEGFIKYMKSQRFELIEGFMMGRWVPLPLWMTKTSYHLPISSRSEYYNTNFFYVFRVSK